MSAETRSVCCSDCTLCSTPTYLSNDVVDVHVVRRDSDVKRDVLLYVVRVLTKSSTQLLWRVPSTSGSVTFDLGDNVTLKYTFYFKELSLLWNNCNWNIGEVFSPPTYPYRAIFELGSPFGHMIVPWKFCEDISNVQESLRWQTYKDRHSATNRHC